MCRWKSTCSGILYVMTMARKYCKKRRWPMAMISRFSQRHSTSVMTDAHVAEEKQKFRIY